jgi:uncharacterized protein YdbL (DUF1318 family)
VQGESVEQGALIMNTRDRRKRAIVSCLATAVAAGLLLAAAAGCVTLKPVVLDRKTQLENQILGSFQRLERELILASSVRGDRPEPKLSPLEREAVEAMMTREFYRDDIDELKQQQVVGETNSGMLSLLKPPSDPAEAKRAQHLVEQENNSRTIIIKRVIQTSEDLTDKDLSLVRRIFYRLNLQTAKPGDSVQRPAGDWDVVQAAPSADPTKPAQGGTP